MSNEENKDEYGYTKGIDWYIKKLRETMPKNPFWFHTTTVEDENNITEDADFEIIEPKQIEQSLTNKTDKP